MVRRRLAYSGNWESKVQGGRGGLSRKGKQESDYLEPCYKMEGNARGRNMYDRNGLLVCKLAPTYKGQQRPKENTDHSKLVGGKFNNKQENSQVAAQ